MQSGSKTCSRCHLEKSLDEFGKNRRRPDGRQTYCKQCAREYAKQRRLSQAVSQYMEKTDTPPVTTERSRIHTRFPPEN